ncbi:hypothetical protein GQ53DRAFT_766284 [Thozetella sp. PMI_491]|nr:hypothetical protein GQ53DRAFT_766284 [Thozetella sp. PMI_491]
MALKTTLYALLSFAACAQGAPTVIEDPKIILFSDYGCEGKSITLTATKAQCHAVNSTKIGGVSGIEIKGGLFCDLFSDSDCETPIYLDMSEAKNCALGATMGNVPFVDSYIIENEINSVSCDYK